MPAPTNGAIQTALTQNLVNAGFVKSTYVNGTVTPQPGVLPDALQKLVQALAQGDALWFSQWQAVQTIVAVGPSFPSTGTLP